MRALFLRLLAASLFALVLVQLLGPVWAIVRGEREIGRAQSELIDEKLAWAAERLEDVPPPARDRAVFRLGRALGLPLRLSPPTPRHAEDRALELSDGVMLVAGPARRRPPPLDIMALQVLVGVLAFGGVLVWLGRPVVRDLNRLEDASVRIAEGDLGARSGLRDGPVATLGTQPTTDARTMARLDGEMDAIDDLLGELLEVARLEEPAVEAAEPEVTEDVVRELCGRLGGSFDGALQIDVAGGLPMGRRDMSRVVGNLVSNAMRHARGVVAVRVRDGLLQVDDDGPGVPRALREQVFEPFYTGDASRNRTLGGVGLGLTLVRRAAVRWGGTASVSESDLGGARFEVRWPG